MTAAPAPYPVPTITPTPAPTNVYLGDPAGISAFAERETDAANAYILQLGTLSASLTPPTIDPVFPAGPSAPAQIAATPPTLLPIVWTSPSAPDAFVGDLTIDDLMPAPFDDNPPVLSFAAAPAAFSELAPTAPGIDLTYVDPGLTVALPAPPDLMSLNTVTFGGITLPTIDPEAIPTLDIAAPTIREYVPGAQYTSALLTAGTAYLQDVIVNGGTGLNADVENAIWDRGREREARSRADALKDLDKMEEMGFALPPGVYLDARLKITTESDFTNRGLSREILIKQAELAYQAGKDMVTLAIQLESKNMDMANALEQRLFEATKYATEAGVSIYNARVQAYAAFLDAYKTKVQIYTAQVQAQLALVEVYKAEVQAESVKATINTSLVEQYKASIEAALSAVEIYKARIEGIRIKAEIEKTKVDIFGAQVQAYAQKINAYTAGVEGYRASLEAEKTKVSIYQSQVEAFSTKVGAAAKEIDARIAAYRGKLDANTNLWEGYKAIIAGEASKAQAISSYNQSAASEYQAEVTAVTSYNETLTKQWQAGIDQAQQVARIGIEAAKANAEMYITTRSLATDAAKVGAQVSAQLGAAALNAINWSTSISSSNSVSNSTSLSASASASTSQNYNYNYSESVSASV